MVKHFHIYAVLVKSICLFFYLNMYFSEVFNYFVLGQIWEYMGTVQNLVRSSYAVVGDVDAAARGGELASGW